MKKDKYARGDRVRVCILDGAAEKGPEGTVVNVRRDDGGADIYTVRLDDPGATPDGLYVARVWELDSIGATA